MGCPICSENAAADANDDPRLVARTPSGYVRLHPNQYYPGTTLFASRACVRELHELGEPRMEYLREMAMVAEAVFLAFEPRKLNYELLGNGAPHLHWWLVPRAIDDPRPRGPIWENLDFLQSLWTEERTETSVMDALRARLRQELEAVGVPILV